MSLLLATPLSCSLQNRVSFLRGDEGEDIRLVKLKKKTSHVGNIPHRRRRRPIEGNANSLSLKSNLEKDFVAVIYLFEASYPTRFLSWGGQAIL
jgi:hypothetical protein